MLAVKSPLQRRHREQITLALFLLYLLTFTSACGGKHGNSTSERQSPPKSPIAESPDQTLSTWEVNMAEYGKRVCDDLDSNSPSSDQRPLRPPTMTALMYFFELLTTEPKKNGLRVRTGLFRYTVTTMYFPMVVKFPATGILHKV